MVLAVLFMTWFPCYYEAQIRAKWTRAEQDMRALGAALEAYAADQKAYPPCVRGVPGGNATAQRKDGADAITTFALRPDGSQYLLSPKPYLDVASSLSAMPTDVFSVSPKTHFGYYASGESWVLFSAGPDRVYDVPDPSRLPTAPGGDLDPSRFRDLTFDASNGTTSRGDIFQFGGQAKNGWQPAR